ncbi:MAG: MBL fold metallo-hydrolase [Candidatus Bathyarchaeum sp.]|nr:MAG: MBL fold metallo-hydrolase [Candidatus Bathyarchaeum sp.]
MYKTRITSALLSVLLVISVTICFTPTASSQSAAIVAVHFIDVGQGDCIFIDTATNDVLIDAGSASASQTVIDYLDYLNVTRIHLLIATHAHADHIGGIVDVLNCIPVNNVIFNNQTHTSATYTNFITAAQTHNLTVAQRGQTFTLTKTANLTVLNPTQPLEFSDQNDNSIVVKLQVQNTSFLFTGDAEEPAEQSMLTSSVVSVKCDVLKIGHHGSNTATSQAFLDLADPTYAIISAGLDNTYGHPHNQTTQKLQTKNVTTYCTINSGTIVAQTDGTTITFYSNPQPIPEIPTNIILPLFAATTLLAVIGYRKKLTKHNTS